MKNITITVDEQIAAWLRIYAAKQGKSVSRFVGELLEGHMRETQEYSAARRRFLASEPFTFQFVDGRRPTREELHDRAGLR